MKVVINIKNPHSQYSKYHGLTFEVRELMHSLVGVCLNKYNQTDFNFSEVIIVDFQDEVKRCLKFNFHYKLEKLKTYAKVNRINIDNLIKDYES